MHPSALEYGKRFFETYCNGRDGITVVDLGSQNVNGSLKDVCFPNINYVGVDFEKANGVDVVLDDPYKLPFEDSSIDVIVCSSVFEHSQFFWVIFLEIIRALKPEGLLYLNVPSNGYVHRYPVDCWRLYPDAGHALAAWAEHNGYSSALLESFIVTREYVALEEKDAAWNDFVAIFIKNKTFKDLYKSRIINFIENYSNGYSDDGLIDTRESFLSNDFLIIDRKNIEIANLNQVLGKLEDKNEVLNKTVAELKVNKEILNKKVTELTADKEILNQVIADKNHQIVALYSSASWKISSPVRILGQQAKVIKHIYKLIKLAVKQTGGVLALFKKVFLLYKRDGLVGVKAGFRFVTRSSEMMSLHNTEFDRNDYAEWVKSYDTLTDEIRASMQVSIDGFAVKPLISVIMPTYNSNAEWLIATIESVRKQIYSNWELCIADDSSTDQTTRQILIDYANKDLRIKLVFREQNGHISAASNSALEITTGDWIALLDHDDLLSEHALYWIVNCINDKPNARLIYSDEDKVDEFGNRSMPFFKPSWSPHLILSQAYLGHLVCYQKKLIKAVGGFDLALNGAQDYALALACANSILPTEVQHISRILYHWRMHPESTAKTSDSKPYAKESGRKAVEYYVKNQYKNSNIEVINGNYTFTYQLKFKYEIECLVSIIIPTKDGLKYLKPCIESIFEKSIWKNIEIIILDNGSEKLETIEYFNKIQMQNSKIKVFSLPIPFNWSKLNNIGAKHASGDVLVFLNNDTQVISPNWINSLVGYANLPNVGVVGALLMFEDGTIQHSGVVVGMGGWADHVYKGSPPNHSGGGPFVSPVITRNVLAVTGACMAISKKQFDFLGGFDESFLICGSDVEICLRAQKLGYFNVMCAEVKLYHYESKTRTAYVPPDDFLQSSLKYAPYREEKTDPYYNRNLSLYSTNPTIQEPPRDS